MLLIEILSKHLLGGKILKSWNIAHYVKAIANVYFIEKHAKMFFYKFECINVYITFCNKVKCHGHFHEAVDPYNMNKSGRTFEGTTSILLTFFVCDLLVLCQSVWISCPVQGSLWTLFHFWKINFFILLGPYNVYWYLENFCMQHCI